MKPAHLSACAVVAAAVPLFACAQTPLPADLSVSGNISLVSDYRYRGVSQTFRLPAVQGGFDVGHSSGFYAGTWASNVSGNNFAGGNGMEWDFYGGFRLDLSRAVQLDVGVLQYYYPGAKNTVGTPPFTSTKRYDTTELYAGATYGPYAGKLSITVGDYFGIPDSSGSWYAEGNYAREILQGVNFVGHIGRQQVHGHSDLNYFDYKAGVTADAFSMVWGLAIVGTNADHHLYRVTASNGQAKDTSKATLVLSVGKTF
jgi:uncharacterized protein (TIGR02001 family)